MPTPRDPATPHGRMAIDNPRRRDALAAEVMLGAVHGLPADARVLVIDDLDGLVEAGLRERHARVYRWCRLTVGDRPGLPWPGAGPFDAACLRLPKIKAAFEMALHAAASVLAPGAPLWVYGANDEGIKSAARVITPIFGSAAAIDARRHCRVIEAHRPREASVRTRLAEWRGFVSPPVAGHAQWVTYPGVFAKGVLDAGTAVLLAALPAFSGQRVLDFGCGGGPIAADILRRAPDAEVHLLEADALSLLAAHENLPGAPTHLSDAWHGLPPGIRFDRVVSNPPIHRGKGEDFEALRALVLGAPAVLRPGGELWMVVQRQVPVGPLLESCLDRVEIARQDSRFRVWRAHAPAR